MESHRIITFTLFLLSLISANLLAIHGASSPNSHYDNFHECLSHQFQLTNSATDIIHTPQNYSFLLQAHNLVPRLSAGPLKPDLIVTPFHESEIQAVIYCSKKLGLQIRVRSGGHDYEGLSYSSPSGTPFMMLDMINFRSITIDDDNKTARIQTGATLGQLYHTLALRGKTIAAPAGACPTVGIGGHLSGGGYGMMARKHSIAADHIIDARLINADGKILDRKSMGEDHFWAIRGGGGGNFGIVIQFTVTLVAVPEKVTVFNITRTSEQNATELIHRWQYIAPNLDDDIVIRLFLHSVKSPTTLNRIASASFTSLYLGRANDLLKLLEEKFPELGLEEKDCMEMSWVESALIFAGLQNQTLDVLLDRIMQGQDERLYFKVKSDFVSTPIPVDGLRGIWRFLHEEDLAGREIQFSPYGGAINTFSESETPFPHRKGNIFMIEYAALWPNPNDTEKHIDWSRRIYAYMAPYVTRSPRAAYVNYRDLDLGTNNANGNTSYEQASAWGLRYFKNNFRRLVRVKTKVDPSNVFRNEQSIPPFPKIRQINEIENFASSI